MTNNETPQSTSEWVTEFHNERDDSESNYDILNNDFNGNRFPFSFTSRVNKNRRVMGL